MAVFYSFHYERDVNRVQLVRNIGVIEGQQLLNSQNWESIKAQGDRAVKNWIDTEMSYKNAVVVLIGAETASRRWVQYEIQRAWELNKPLLGIRIHGLADLSKGTDTAGPNPFQHIKGLGEQIPNIPIFDPTYSIYDVIDSKQTYRNLSSQLPIWVNSGVRRY